MPAMNTQTVNLRDVPEDLVKRAKVCAAMRGLSLKDFILQAVEQALSEAGPDLASVTLFVSGGAGRRERRTGAKARRKIKP